MPFGFGKIFGGGQDNSSSNPNETNNEKPSTLNVSPPDPNKPGNIQIKVGENSMTTGPALDKKAQGGFFVSGQSPKGKMSVAFDKNGKPVNISSTEKNVKKK